MTSGAARAAFCKGLRAESGGPEKLKEYGPFSLIVAFDVLEHLEDDREAVQQIYGVLVPGGVAAVTVPAYPWLYSYHDQALGHYQRYSRRRLLDLFRDAGFEVQKAAYFNAVGLFGAVVWRAAGTLLGTRRPDTLVLAATPAVLDAVLARAAAAESRVTLRWDLPIGLSLFLVARKGGD